MSLKNYFKSMYLICPEIGSDPAAALQGDGLEELLTKGMPKLSS
jgi:hypothetical protein